MKGKMNTQDKMKWLVVVDVLELALARAYYEANADNEPMPRAFLRDLSDVARKWKRRMEQETISPVPVARRD